MEVGHKLPAMKQRKRRLLFVIPLLFWPFQAQATAKPSTITTPTTHLALDVFQVVPAYQAPSKRYDDQVLAPIRTWQQEQAAKIEAETQACESQGGSFDTDNDSCLMPPPPPPPAPTQPTDGNVKDIITYWANQYGVDPTLLLNVANCESTLNPSAVNPTSGDTGIFQFSPSTFADHGGTNIYDVNQQAQIAAQMWAAGEGNQWACQ